MTRNTILILGDSTSMTAGVERETYPFHVASQPVWSPESCLVNCSIPGFASLDAAKFYFRNRASLGTLRAVVIYLGNCDAMATELPAKRYSVLKDKLGQFLRSAGSRDGKLRLKNKLLYYQWNPEFDQDVESPISIADFEHNIGLVAADCQGKGIPVVLVRPMAHLNFPSGAGKGNFVFYHYLGLGARIAERVTIEDARFVAAMRQYEEGKFGAACQMYKDILDQNGPLSTSLEYQSLVAHNYAVSAARDERIDEADYLLQLLLQERGARKEIILYNLAGLARLRGDQDAYQSALRRSFEADLSMYRVREPYQEAIDRIGARYDHVSVVKLEEIVSDDDFVDHCHLLPALQRKLAERVLKLLPVSSMAGDSELEIENRLFSPEYGQGNDLAFHDYFRSFADTHDDKNERQIDHMLGLIDSAVSPKQTNEALGKALESGRVEIRQAFEYFQRHPVFPEYRFAVLAGPNRPSDLGRFPEFFLFRFLVPFLKVFEQDDALAALFSPEFGILRSSDEFRRILPDDAHVWIEDNFPAGTDAIAGEWADAILAKVRSELVRHLEMGNRIQERLISTIFWYFRETLRFGSHSRVSMRYERVFLEFTAEALAVAAVLDKQDGSSRRQEIEALAGHLDNIVSTHESYCSRYSPQGDNAGLLREYDSALAALLRKIGSGPKAKRVGRVAVS